MKKKIVISTIIFLIISTIIAIGSYAATETTVYSNGGIWVMNFSRDKNPTFTVTSVEYNNSYKIPTIKKFGDRTVLFRRNVFCTQHGYYFYGDIDFSDGTVSELQTTTNTQMAYIISKQKKEAVIKRDAENEHEKSDSQQAYWWYTQHGNPPIKWDDMTTNAKNFYYDSEDFATYRNLFKSKKFEKVDTTVTVSTVDDGYKVGPYKINYRIYKHPTRSYGKVFGGISEVKINATMRDGTNKDLILGTDFYILYGSNKKISQKTNLSNLPNAYDGGSFYIIITNKEVASLGEIIFKEKETQAKAQYYSYKDGSIAGHGTSYVQNIIFVYYGKVWETENELKFNLNQTLIPPAEITLTKASSNGGTLSGAVFDVVATQESEPLKSGTITTTGGKATFVCQPTSRDKDVVITITEKTAPTGSGGIYKKLNSAMVITLTYDTSSNKWKATKTTDTEGVLEITNATTIDIKVTNQFIAKIDLNLTKASSLGGNLRGAKFKVDASQDGGKVTPNSSTITTNSTGKATFTCQPTTEADVTIKITEIEKPTDSVGNYEKLNKTMVIKLTYNRAEHKWTATEITDEEKVLGITNTTKVDITITNQYISPIKIGGDIDGFGGFDKVDQAGNPVVGAEFKAVFEQDGEKLATKTATSNTAGKLDFEEVKPKTTSNVRVTITETKAPAGYENSGYAKTIDFEYNTKEHTWEPLTNDVNANVEYKDKITYVDIDNVVNKSQIDKLTLIKRDSQDSSKLAGAKFKITLSNIEKIKKYNITSDPTNIEVDIQNGELTLEELVIRDVTNPVIITLEETLAPKGYKKIEGTITLTITRVGTEYTIVTSADETVRASDEFRTDVIKLTPGEDGIVKGDVNKNGILDAGDALLILKNSVGKYDFDEELKKIADVTGDNRVNSADAQWVLSHKTSVPNSGSAIGLGGKGDVNGDGKITEADAEKILKYSVGLITEIDLEKADVDGNGVVNSADALRILKYLAGEKEGSTGNVTENNHKIEVKMNDIPVMNLGGIVWKDAVVDGKVVNGPDGKHSSGEAGYGGIVVRLLKKGEPVTTDVYGNTLIKKTVAKRQEMNYRNPRTGNSANTILDVGEYLFPNIEKSDKYIVQFTYDGIHWETVSPASNPYTSDSNNQSKVTEIDRAEFNEKFKIINNETTVDGTRLEYEQTTINNEAKSKLITEKDGELINIYKMNATSQEYMKPLENWKDTWNDDGTINEGHYALNINCGLKERYFDLAIGLDVEKAEVSINGKTTEYGYAQVLNGELANLSDELDTITEGKKEYNLYLYESDYNYRIGAYGNTGDLTNQDSAGKTEIAKDTNGKKELELKAKVTYKLIIYNQSVENGRATKIVNYYDPTIYTLRKSGEGYSAEIVEPGKAIITINEYTDRSKEIYLEYDVNKLEETRELVTGDNIKNYAEILEYTTDNGIVDYDSAPGNFNPNEPIYEDDTDSANAINIKVKDNYKRVISGQVFEDTDLDETKLKGTNPEDTINNVIVQLIELRDINIDGTNMQFEYIWQEAETGNKRVKYTKLDGTGISEYDIDGDINTGEYKFIDFVPGNYIVRFIYGDGTYYDKAIDMTNNDNDNKDIIKKYNGEDYKSTYDKDNYNATSYNTSTLYTEVNTSKAVDNEARRLKVMSYAVDVDSTKGSKLALLDKKAENLTTEETKTLRDDVLSNTWMCAETPRINVTVDSDTMETDLNNTKVGDGNTVPSNIFENVNFGLMERPKTKLVLEKHITELTVTAQAGTPLTEARADIKDDIMNAEDNAIITPEGKIDGLIAVKSTRYNRGQWYLQTDTTELGQGTTAKITYTYAITNKGDKDYLSSTLVDLYKNRPIDEYANELIDLEGEVKEKMQLGEFSKGTYLGQFYYTRVGTSDKEVLATVEQIQEFINPELTYSGDDVANQIRKDTTVVMPVNKKRYTNEDVLGDINVKEKIESTAPTRKLQIKDGDYSEENTDFDKRFMVEKVLSAQEIEDGGVYDSYLADITHYTNAAGRRDESTPDNLSYVHSEDTNMNLETYIYTEPDTNNVKLIVSEIVMVLDTATGTTVEEEVYTYYGNDAPNGIEAVGATKGENGTIIYNGNTYTKLNEQDEFWAETFKITKPTGEDKLTPVQIAIITVSAVAILGVGIILIKKFVLKK